MNFFHKFFWYFENEEGYLQTYMDNLGQGCGDIRHIIWIVTTIIITIIISIFAQKKPEKTRKIIKIFLIYMFFQRLIKQIIITYLKIEQPIIRSILPIHLCSITIYLLPIVVCFNLKRIKQPTYFLSIIGGIVTVVAGDYFENKFLTFYDVEPIIAHTILIFASIGMIFIERERFSLKEVLKTLIMLIICASWATFMNCILGIMGYQTNYLHLVTNLLPNNFGGRFFIFVYELIFLILLIFTYIFSNRKNIKNIKIDFKQNNLFFIMTVINLIVVTILIILLNSIFGIKKLSKIEKDISSAVPIYQVSQMINRRNFNEVETFERVLKEISKENLEVEEYNKNKLKITLKESGVSYIIKKSDISVVEKVKQNIVEKIILKIMIVLEIIILEVDAVLLIIKNKKLKLQRRTENG